MFYAFATKNILFLSRNNMHVIVYVVNGSVVGIYKCWRQIWKDCYTREEDTDYGYNQKVSMRLILFTMLTAMIYNVAYIYIGSILVIKSLSLFIGYVLKNCEFCKLCFKISFIAINVKLNKIQREVIYLYLKED